MPRKLSLDHVSLPVRSLEASGKFYTEVIGLDPIANGSGKSNIRWFGIGGEDALHLIEADLGDRRPDKASHFAMRIADFDGFIAELEAREIPFHDWTGTGNNVTARPDGFRQIFIADPDGYWVEVNDHV
jgi:catechol 2,3-dioxygenase-like lactoylglutathione lyase family enzyme